MVETSREDIIAITNPNSHSTFQIVDSIPLHPPFILQELEIDFNHQASSRLSSDSRSKPRYSVPSARPFFNMQASLFRVSLQHVYSFEPKEPRNILAFDDALVAATHIAESQGFWVSYLPMTV